METKHVLSDNKPDPTNDEDMRKDLDRSLEEALKDTFPASDPVNVVQPARKPTDKARGGRRK